MWDRPESLDEDELRAVLRTGWCIRVESLTHLPVGFGSHHWSATDQRGSEWFVKVDDLGFVADGRDEEFGRLSRSQETALALHRDAGLGFVLAPVSAENGAPLWRLSSRYALSVFPAIARAAGQFGPHRREELAEVTGLVAEVHRATPAVAQLAPPERDVWMLTDAFAGMLREEPTGADAQVHSRYRRISGRTVSPAGIALYRLWWPLADVAAFLDDLRRPHGDGVDAAAALRYLTGNLEGASA